MTDDVSDAARSIYNAKATEQFNEDATYYFPEKYQLGILADWLSTNGIAYTTEAEIFSYPIDVLASKYETTVAIELKSRNIGKGIDQALRNSDFVDYSYLSVWEQNVTDTLIQRVEDKQIGLIGIDDTLTVHVVASESPQQLCRKPRVIELIKNNVRGDISVQQQQGQADD
ncbi:hypothetical protein ACFQL9_13310 [Halobaculum lipolyticum]|uniref:DUF4143 domain-containing protein n=1 Tax=Halobaculum lipolyticum TaxID=3032001 RepID=A0ABD5WBG3_9EURY